MGIGWNSEDMKGDLNTCKYVYSTTGTPQFTAIDWTSINPVGYNFQFTGQTNNMEGINTVTANRTSGTFVCNYKRRLDTGDTNDYVIPTEGEFELYYAYGAVNSASPYSGL